MKPINKFSYSELRDWRRCRQKWHYGYVMKLEPLIPKAELRKGGAIHSALKAFYTLPPEKRSLLALVDSYEVACLHQLQELPDPDTDILNQYEKQLTDGKSMLSAYWGKFGQDSSIANPHIEDEIAVPVG